MSAFAPIAIHLSRRNMNQKQIKTFCLPILCLFSLSIFAQGTRVRVTAETASVYLGSSVLGTVENGHEFRSMEKRDKWYAVTLVIDGQAKVGWVKESDVEVVDKLETALIAPPLPDGLYRKDGAIFSKKDGAVLVRIPAGEFIPGTRSSHLMGKVAKERLDEFYLDAYEVTNAQYMKFFSEAGYQKPKYIGEERFNGPRQPVVGVSLDDAKAYAAWAGRRLPTSLEWEKAARGPNGNSYPWGKESPTTSHSAIGMPLQTGAPKGIGTVQLDRSFYGVFDMAGNVQEWTSTRDGIANYLARGFSWSHSSKMDNPLGHKFSVPATSQDATRGFRCALSEK